MAPSMSSGTATPPSASWRSIPRRGPTLLLADGLPTASACSTSAPKQSDPGAATIERATYVPKLAQSAASARLPIYVVANGQDGASNRQAQGLGFVALDGGLDQEATEANSARLQSSRNVLTSAPAVTASGRPPPR